MTPNDPYAELVARLGKSIIAIGLIGAIVAAFQWGPNYGAGFAIGAAGAFLNMRWLANALLSPKGPAGVVLALRFGILGGGVYVILKVFEIAPLSILAGLLSAALAAVLEVLFQLFYART